MPRIGGNDINTGGGAGSTSGAQAGKTRISTGRLKRDETTRYGEQDGDSVLSVRPPNKVRRTTDDADSYVDYYKTQQDSVTSTHSGQQRNDDDSSEDSQEGGQGDHPIGIQAKSYRPYSGLALAASKLIKSQVLEDLLRVDLAWQKPAGDAGEIKRFKGEVLTQSGLVVFGFMRPGSPFIHLLHGPQTYTTYQTNQRFEPLRYWLCWGPNTIEPYTHTGHPFQQNNLGMGAKTIHSEHCTTDHFLCQPQQHGKIVGPPYK